MLARDAPKACRQSTADACACNLLCYGTATSQAASSTATRVGKKAAWAWIAVPIGVRLPYHCLPNGSGAIVSDDHLGRLEHSEMAAELKAIGEALSYALSLPQSENVCLVVLSNANVIPIITTSSTMMPIRSTFTAAIDKVRCLLRVVQQQRKVTWKVNDNDWVDEKTYLQNAVHKVIDDMHYNYDRGKGPRKRKGSEEEVKDWLNEYLKVRGIEPTLSKSSTSTSSTSTSYDNKNYTLHLKKLAKDRFENKLTDGAVPSRATSTSNLMDSWGRCHSVCTFNLNRLPWTKLGSWLSMLEAETLWSLVAIQEVFEETGEIDEGWWSVDGHKILVGRTHHNMLAGMVLHKSFCPSVLPDFKAGEGSVSTSVKIGMHEVRVCACYLPQTGVDRVDPEKFF
eukprot:6491863-Amphidinium_carterae.1